MVHMSNPVDQNLVVLQAGAELPHEKKFYFNGFSIGISPMDVAIVLLHHNQPIAHLSTSHIMAKSLAEATLALIAGQETSTGQKVPTLDELRILLDKQQKNE